MEVGYTWEVVTPSAELDPETIKGTNSGPLFRVYTKEEKMGVDTYTKGVLA